MFLLMVQKCDTSLTQHLEEALIGVVVESYSSQNSSFSSAAEFLAIAIRYSKIKLKQ